MTELVIDGWTCTELGGGQRATVARLRALLAKDARALWAIRVLDAWAAPETLGGTRSRAERHNRRAHEVTLLEGYEEAGRYEGPTPDAARLAAADALATELGDRCPRRPT